MAWHPPTILADPSLTARWFHTVLVPFQPLTPPSHPFPGCCLGLSITSSTFHEPLKHPPNLSPGRPKPCYNKSASLQPSWEQVHGSAPKDICFQQGGKATLSTPAPRSHQPLGTNPAGPSSTAPHDHAGLLTGIEQPLLQEELEEDCMAVTQVHTQRFFLYFVLSSKHTRRKLIPPSTPVLDVSLPVLNERQPVSPWTLPSLLPHSLWTAVVLHKKRDGGRPKLLLTMSQLSKGGRFSGHWENKYSERTCRVILSYLIQIICSLQLWPTSSTTLGES